MDIRDRALLKAGKFFKLSDRFNDDHLFAIVGHPNRNGVAPVAITREAPVSCIGKPVVETLFLDNSRHPFSFFVFLNEFVLNISDFDEPAVESTINKRSLTSPAEGITMLDSSLVQKTATGLQIFHNL